MPKSSSDKQMMRKTKVNPVFENTLNNVINLTFFFQVLSKTAWSRTKRNEILVLDRNRQKNHSIQTSNHIQPVPSNWTTYLVSCKRNTFDSSTPWNSRNRYSPKRSSRFGSLSSPRSHDIFFLAIYYSLWRKKFKRDSVTFNLQWISQKRRF